MARLTGTLQAVSRAAATFRSMRAAARKLRMGAVDITEVALAAGCGALTVERPNDAGIGSRPQPGAPIRLGWPRNAMQPLRDQAGS